MSAQAQAAELPEMGCTEILLTPRGTQLACSIHDQHPAGHWAKHP